MKKIKFLETILFFSLFQFVSAQELNCNININSDLIQGTNKSVFTTLQKSMYEFINNRKWTEMTFTPEERIECTMNITVKKVEGDNFTAEILVQSRRPVYNSSYTTTLFNFKDNDFTFTYKEFDQLEWNPSVITSNLTAVLSYYAYIIIGYDMDSFSRLGGTSAFQAAENIVNMAQGINLSGWKAFESPRNRYALVSNLLDEAFKPFRNYFYEYHRLGLDMMVDNPANARAKIAEGLHVLRDVNRARPSAVVISSFLDAKTDELMNIFSKGTEKEKMLVVEILSDVDPAQTAKYEQILNSK
ncbi:MAG TPA: DUF4835 family protein [Paludibacteraceae bacterium]|nr:DUF4835 family protein [Paludibacteraceae bacterium]